MTLTARAVSTPTEPRPLGLTMRIIQRVGVEVLRVASRLRRSASGNRARRRHHRHRRPAGANARGGETGLRGGDQMIGRFSSRSRAERLIMCWCSRSHDAVAAAQSDRARPVAHTETGPGAVAVRHGARSGGPQSALAVGTLLSRSRRLSGARRAGRLRGPWPRPQTSA